MGKEKMWDRVTDMNKERGKEGFYFEDQFRE